MSSSRRPNRLLGQTSPYLLQHLYNPVDWHPWGPQALARSRDEDKPIFLSIGYAACHWCHVMERESFEDPAIASLLNENFVPIKVDREERPDIDEIYMNAVQLLTGTGGWPLNVFLTPQLEPFTGGTYFPPRPRHGMIGFPELLMRVDSLWRGDDRERLRASAAQLTRRLHELAGGYVDGSSSTRIGRAEWSRAVAELSGRFDAVRGGFGSAPKFPPDGALALLLREHAGSGDTMPLRMVEATLDGMARGGMYDQIGGGFARYSVDERWLVPHFEKMLYSQALLVPLYVDAWLIGGKPLYRRAAEETLDFVRRELADERGGFYSSLDADSEGREGAFYVWTPEQVVEALGEEDGRLFNEIYGIVPGGNFEGASIANLLSAGLEERAAMLGVDEQQLVERLAPLRARLLEARERRPRPATDDKVLTAWNGLMIGAFARAFRAFGRRADLDAACRAADFASTELLENGRLRASWREGKAALNGYLDDYAFLGRGLLELYEAAFDRRYLELSEQLARTLLERFEDAEQGGFFFTSDDHEALLTRNRSTHDGALPAGAGVATELLLRLALHLDDDELRRPALRCLESYRPIVERLPSSFASLLLAADLAEHAPLELAIVGDPEDARTAALLDAANGRYLPRLAIALDRPGQPAGRLALLREKAPTDGVPTAWLCRNYACSAPVTSAAELLAQLDAARQP